MPYLAMLTKISRLVSRSRCLTKLQCLRCPKTHLW